MFNGGMVASLTSQKLAQIAVTAVSIMPPNWCLYLERAAREGQGKGWGAESTSAEVKSCISLLADRQISPLIAIDAGANVGNWTASLLEAIPKSLMFAFEPSKLAFTKTRETLSRSRPSCCC